MLNVIKSSVLSFALTIAVLAGDASAGPINIMNSRGIEAPSLTEQVYYRRYRGYRGHVGYYRRGYNPGAAAAVAAAAGLAGAAAAGAYAQPYYYGYPNHGYGYPTYGYGYPYGYPGW
jgi:hypothetical protein